jgi:integrase
MATVERRGERYRLIFYHAGRRYAASLKTTKERDADSIAGSVDRTLMLLQQGALALPPGADLVTFVLSGGRVEEKPKPPPIRTLSELKDRYLQAVGLGAMEANSLDTVRMHLGHFVKSLGANFPIQTLTLDHLQQHIERRAKKKGHYRKPISPVTLKKEMTSFRACWNWGVSAGLVTGKFPTNKALKYPKEDQKPPFQTWEEIERTVARGGLSEAEEKALWDCLYLTLPQVQDFLSFAEANARHGFLYPMLVAAAHTGAMRSELIAARVEDVDFQSGTIHVREKKRVQGQRSYRRVPMSAELEKVLRDWIGRHPGGRYLFCHRLEVPRSKKRRTACVPLTRNEANDHFKRLVGESKWKVLRGWHVFRHSFISNCASKGVDQRMIDEWAGHQTEGMRKRYRHLIPSTQRQALQSVFGQGQ